MLLNLIQLKNKYSLKIKGILHIGAHWGQEYDTYKKIGVEKMIFFEPHPGTFGKLKSKIKETELVKLYQIALGNKEGKETMYVETGNAGQSNSLLEPDKHLKYYGWIRFNNTIQVPIKKLDNIEFNRNDFNFINIDVQGYELEVFKGASKTLENIDYIMTEVNTGSLYKGCVLLDELDEYLKEFGFRRVESEIKREEWGDAFYIKSLKK